MLILFALSSFRALTRMCHRVNLREAGNAVVGVNEDPESKYLSSMCSGGLVLIEGGAAVKAGADIPKGSMIEVE